MAKKTKPKTTTRSYTLALSPAPIAGSVGPEAAFNLKDRLFRTHYAISRGAAVFSDLFLNLRGGFIPALAVVPADTEPEKVELTLRGTRRVLALGWFSVEDASQSEHPFRIREVENGQRMPADLAERLLRDLLRSRGIVDESELASWVADVRGALVAHIRNDAVWINRAAAFDDWQSRFPNEAAAEMAEHARKILFGMCGAEFVMLELPDSTQPSRDEAVVEEGEREGENENEGPTGRGMKPVEPSNASRRFFGDLFGGDPGLKKQRLEEKAHVAVELRRFLQSETWDKSLGQRLLKWRDSKQWAPLDGSQKFPVEVASTGRASTVAKRYRKLLVSLDLWPQTQDEDGAARSVAVNSFTKKVPANANHDVAINVLDLIEGCDELSPPETSISNEDVDGESDDLETEQRVYRPCWASDVEARLTQSTSLSPSDKSSNEFKRLMFALAARRISQTQSWVKRNEISRHKASETEREALTKLEVADPTGNGREWLRAYEARRSDETQASDDFRVTERTIECCDEVLAAWEGILTEDSARAYLATHDPDELKRLERDAGDLIVAARCAAIAQVQREAEKFGSASFYADFATRAAEVAWLSTSVSNELTASTQILKQWVKLRAAQFDETRFKVPRFCHPDPFQHPTWGEFGESSKPGAWYAWAGAQPKKPEPGGEASGSRRVWLLLPDFKNQCSRPVPLLWHSNRLTKDFGEASAAVTTPGLPRNDRLGRAAQALPATDAASQSKLKYQPVLPFSDDSKWNARLQMDREQLKKLADQWDEANGCWRDKGQELRRAKWFLTFAPDLELPPQRINEVLEQQGLKKLPGPELNKKQDRKHWMTKLGLQRLPGLRIVSVDLGHRYAAACAVWETVSTSDFEQRRREAHEELVQRDGQRGVVDLYCHLKFPTERLDKHGQRFFKTEIYRRIGPETLADGSPHPAPWARLDRQFLIRLQGEDRPCRAATGDEVAKVDALREWLGLSERQGASRRSFGDASLAFDASPVLGEPAASALRLTTQPMLDPLLEDIEFAAQKQLGTVTAPQRVDGLMAEAVRLAELGLKRLGFLARIANALIATQRPQMGGVVRTLTPEERIAVLQDELARWFELAHSTVYTDRALRGWWYDHIAPLLAGEELQPLDENATRPAQKVQRESWKSKLRRAAETLASSDNSELFELLQREWQQRETTWQKQHLRWLRDWLMPRGGKSQAKNKGLRQVGGLSLKRIQTLRSLYKVMKAFHQRPKPNDLLAGKKQVEEDAQKGTRFGQRMLDAFERLRENRIKQLASRIVEAALGVGSENRSHWDGHKRARQRVDLQVVKDEVKRRFKPCHVVVIENLERYKPDETQTRRENRQLMDWSARNVRKFILQGCQLHGLYFTEVMPQYTSRQDSRTGAPGVRCHEVRTAVLRAAALQVAELKSCVGLSAQECDSTQLKSPRFEQQVRFMKSDLERSLKRLGKADSTEHDRYLIDLAKQTLTGDAQWQRDFKTVCIPRRGAELFVSAQPAIESHSGVVQADLNAAANIGLRALMDPDWPGAWWYIPAQLKDGFFVPADDKTAGCPSDLFGDWKLGRLAGCFGRNGDEIQPETSARRSGRSPRSITNLWRDVSAESLTEGGWQTRKEYQQRVEQRVFARLRRMMRLAH